MSFSCFPWHTHTLPAVGGAEELLLLWEVTHYQPFLAGSHHLYILVTFICGLTMVYSCLQLITVVQGIMVWCIQPFTVDWHFSEGFSRTPAELTTLWSDKPMFWSAQSWEQALGSCNCIRHLPQQDKRAPLFYHPCPNPFMAVWCKICRYWRNKKH